MNFSDVVPLLQSGRGAKRTAPDWMGAVRFPSPTEESPLVDSYYKNCTVMFKTRLITQDGKEWDASMADLVADDWEIEQSVAI